MGQNLFLMSHPDVSLVNILLSITRVSLVQNKCVFCQLRVHFIYMYVCVPSQTQGVQWYGGSPSHRSCLASAFHAPRRCASATSW